jgi:hypothetical protein
MPRALYLLANLLGCGVLVLLLIDPTRPLAPVFVLLGLAAGDTKKRADGVRAIGCCSVGRGSRFSRTRSVPI